MDTFAQLSHAQRAIIHRIVSRLDTEEDSVVITNPLKPQGPIVYVTNAWQDMCGYNMSQAVGQNPRLTQGEGTDPETVRSMKLALCAQQPCRVRIINYRGYNREPFWNCLSVQPIFFNRQLVLFAARLQDYSHRMSRLVTLSPAQFCKSGDLYQVRVRLPDLKTARGFAQARIVDVTDEDLGWDSKGGHGGEAADAAAAADASTSSGGPAAGAPLMQMPARHVKRLGFGSLELEPEYLLDRLRHECAELGLPVQAQEVRVHGAEVMRMEVCSAGCGVGCTASSASSASSAAASSANVAPAAIGTAGDSSSSSSAMSSSSGGAGASGVKGGGAAPGAGASGGGGGGGGAPAVPVAALGVGVAAGAGGAGAPGSGLRALVHVLPEGGEGTYSISLMRLVGDTFEFHALYRALRDRLTDITVPSKRAC